MSVDRCTQDHEGEEEEEDEDDFGHFELFVRLPVPERYGGGGSKNLKVKMVPGIQK